MTYNLKRRSHHLGACLDGWLFDFRLRVHEQRRDSCSCCPKASPIVLVLCRCRLSKEYGSCCQHIPCLWLRAPPFLSALWLLILVVVSEKVRNNQHRITRLSGRGHTELALCDAILYPPPLIWICHIGPLGVLCPSLASFDW